MNLLRLIVWLCLALALVMPANAAQLSKMDLSKLSRKNSPCSCPINNTDPDGLRDTTPLNYRPTPVPTTPGFASGFFGEILRSGATPVRFPSIFDGPSWHHPHGDNAGFGVMLLSNLFTGGGAPKGVVLAEHLAGSERLLAKAAQKVPAVSDGYFNLISHAGEHALEMRLGMGIGTAKFGPEAVAALFEQNAEWIAAGRPGIRLIACDTGKLAEGFAQKLSDLLGVEVLGATNKVRINATTGNFRVLNGGRFESFMPRR